MDSATFVGHETCLNVAFIRSHHETAAQLHFHGHIIIIYQIGSHKSFTREASEG